MKTGKTIMVVEDDPFLRDTICGVLEDAGHNAVGMEDGAQAMNYLSSSKVKPDVILLDLIMPGMNGWQFRETQLLIADTALIPVVVMTSSRELRNIDADAVIFKPFESDQLLEVIARQTESAGRGEEELTGNAGGGQVSVDRAFKLAETEDPYAHRAEQDLIDHAHEMDQTIRMHNRFLGLICRELRDPLETLRTVAVKLVPGCDPILLQTYKEQIVRITGGMEHLISQLSDTSEISVSQPLSLAPIPFDMAEVTREIIEQCRDMFTGEVKVISQGDTAGTWDKKRIANLISSLVINASRNSDANSPVTILIEGSSDAIVSVIVGNNHVIPERLNPALLDPLHGELDTEASLGGLDRLSLGFFLARQTVLAHDGTFSLETSESRGTTVTIQLPRHAVSPALKHTTKPRLAISFD